MWWATPLFLCAHSALFPHRQIKQVGTGSPAGYYSPMSYVRYSCELCGHEVQPGQSGTMKLVLAWVRSDNNTGIKGVKNQHKYAHSICIETETKRGKQEGSNGEQTLF